MWNRPDRAKLLDHPTRRAVLDIVRAEPGIPFSKLSERVASVSGHSSLGYGSLSYHLYKLERADVLASRRSGRHRRYYEVGPNIADPTALSVVQRPGTFRVATELAERGEVNGRQLAAALQSSWRSTRRAVSYHVRLLRDAGLLQVARSGKHCIYSSTSRLNSCVATLRRAAGTRSSPTPTITTMPSDLTRA